MMRNIKRLALAAIIAGALLMPTQAAAPKTEIGTAWTQPPATAIGTARHVEPTAWVTKHG